MSTLHTVASIKNIMSSYRIGTVERVDFTPINKKPGFGENVDEIVMSAFVHFSDPLLGYDNCYNYMSDSYLGNNDFWDDITCNQPYKLQISRNEYWICLKNKNPVQYTMMNIHQVVENSRHLENLVEEQKNKIQELEKKMDNMDEVIRQFVGGLYCQRTQQGILENFLRVLDGEGFSQEPLPEDTHNWSHWPTTRQGDDSEKRISELELYMRDVTRDICQLKYPCHASIAPMFNCEEQDSYLLMRKHENSNIDCDNDSISTHSSMPDLMDINSVSTHSSMPDLEAMEKQYEKHYENNYERFRNSYEICGNN
jgi:hypothetical protein